MARKSSSLRTDPQVSLGGKDRPDLPVNTIAKQFGTLNGQGLEIISRTNPRLCRAAMFGFVYSYKFGVGYVDGRCDQNLRLAESFDGQSRRDYIDLVKAGGSVPDAYYSDGKKNRNGEFVDLHEEQED